MFLGADVCSCLGLTDTTMSLNALRPDKKFTLNRIECGFLRGGSDVNLVSESGLKVLLDSCDITHSPFVGERGLTSFDFGSSSSSDSFSGGGGDFGGGGADSSW